MALGTNVLWSSLKHIIWHLWGTVELQIHTKYTKCQGTIASGAVELYQTHWRALDSGELWSCLKQTGGHLAPVRCGAISNTLNGTWFQSNLDTIGDTKDTTQYIAQYITAKCSTIQYTVWYSKVQCNTVHSTVQYSKVQYSTVHNTV